MNKQKGFTLLEVMVTLAIGGAVLVAAFAVFFELMWGSGRMRGQALSDVDVNTAALAIQKDLLMTQTSNLTDGDPNPQNSVALSWVDYTGFESSNYTSHSSSYNVTGADLWRRYDGVSQIVGRKITYLGFTQQDRIINVVITSTDPGPPSKNKTLEFSVLMRAEQEEE